MRILIAAGGTGGHIFPALAIAECLVNAGHDVHWIGSRGGMEERLVGDTYPMSLLSIKGVRGKGLLSWLSLPVNLWIAMKQAKRILHDYQPDRVLVMGGFVSGPAGLAARRAGIPLFLHEQNTIPGLTNRLLARIATGVMEAFPHSFPSRYHAACVGNPLRPEFFAQKPPADRFAPRKSGVRIFVLGGSRGARFLNQQMPILLSRLSEEMKVEVIHQTGKYDKEFVISLYGDLNFKADIKAFVDNMAQAMGWADLVIARAGALTVSEIAAIGVGALFVPFPSAVDDHQTRNARFLADQGGAMIVQQKHFNQLAVLAELKQLIKKEGKLLALALASHAQANSRATARVLSIVLGESPQTSRSA